MKNPLTRTLKETEARHLQSWGWEGWFLACVIVWVWPQLHGSSASEAFSPWQAHTHTSHKHGARSHTSMEERTQIACTCWVGSANGRIGLCMELGPLPQPFLPALLSLALMILAIPSLSLLRLIDWLIMGFCSPLLSSPFLFRFSSGLGLAKPNVMFVLSQTSVLTFWSLSNRRIVAWASWLWTCGFG